jgi:hypothetical protein
MADARLNPESIRPGRRARLAPGIALLLGSVACAPDQPPAPVVSPASAAPTSVPTGVVRLAGAVEAVRAFTVVAPRLSGAAGSAPLVITRLTAGGTGVEAGDVLV